MRKLICALLALFIAVPCFAIAEQADIYTIDFSSLSREDLVWIRDRADEQISALDEMENQSGEPQYSSMSLDKSMESIATYSDNERCIFRSYEFDPGKELTILVDVVDTSLDPYNTTCAVRFSIDFARRAFSRNDIQQISFYFYEPSTNENLKNTEMISMMMRISEYAFSWIDIDYIYDWTGGNALSYLESIDSFYLHPSYKVFLR